MARPWYLWPLMATLCAPLFAESLSEPIDARLTQVVGNTVTLSNRKEKVKGPPPVVDIPLHEGDWIKTETASTADISINSQTLLRLKFNSAVQLMRLAPNDIVIRLAYGALLCKVQFDKKDNSHFAVITPNGIANVRGTEFVVEETGPWARIGVLDEGHVGVKVRGFKKEIVMHFNQEIQVHHDSPPRQAHVLEKLYHYKIDMAEMRTRLKFVNKQWNKLTLAQRQHIRTGWARRHHAR